MPLKHLQHGSETLATYAKSRSTFAALIWNTCNIHLITSKTLETYICNIWWGRGQGRLMSATSMGHASWVPLALWGLIWGVRWHQQRQQRVACCPCPISFASLDAIAEGGCGLSSVERDRGRGWLVAALGLRCHRRGTKVVERAWRTKAARWLVNYGGEEGRRSAALRWGGDVG
jgi:hypothetical protein